MCQGVSESTDMTYIYHWIKCTIGAITLSCIALSLEVLVIEGPPTRSHYMPLTLIP